MKKLLIATPCHSLHGGVEVIVNDLVRALPSRGWEVTLGLAGGSRFNLPERYEAEHPGLPTAHMNCFSGTSEGRIRALVASIRNIRPDIVMSARIFDLYESMRRMKRERPELRFAVTIQCYEHDYLADLARWSSQVDLCVTSGELIRQACIQLCGLERNRVISIPGGVSACAHPRPVRAGALRLGYAGRLDQDQKRVGDLVAIAKNLMSQNLDFTLRIAGTGPEEAALKSAFSQLPDVHVEFLGWIGDRTTYLQFLSTLDIFLHTASREGVSIAPRESMACGAVPVISEFTGFWTEGHFRPGTNCLSFPVGDTGMAAQHVLHLARNPAVLASLSRAAQSSESGIYSEDGALDAWAEAFNECLRRPAANPACGVRNEQDTGRLSRWGISPALAQTLRELLGIRMVHSSPGAEWPHAGGRVSEGEHTAFEQFALAQEQRSKQSYAASQDISFLAQDA
jgi:glycosyltransferase involved in cell wall biosynthesis